MNSVNDNLKLAKGALLRNTRADHCLCHSATDVAKLAPRGTLVSRFPRIAIPAALGACLVWVWFMVCPGHASDSRNALSAFAESHSPQYVATVWQTEQGLPQNSINVIVQDHEGYLWLATNAGLARFDGVRFRVFGAQDFPSLQSSRFQALYASRSGELWIGTRNGGLIRLHDGIVTTYLERDGLPSRNIMSIREDAEGKLWINTIKGIACCAGGKLQAYSTYRGKTVREFFLQARDGSMWFRSGMDVVRFGTDGSIATLSTGALLPGRILRCTASSHRSAAMEGRRFPATRAVDGDRYGWRVAAAYAGRSYSGCGWEA